MFIVKALKVSSCCYQLTLINKSYVDPCFVEKIQMHFLKERFVLLCEFQHWLKQMIDPKQATVHCLDRRWLRRHIHAPLCPNESTEMHCLTKRLSVTYLNTSSCHWIWKQSFDQEMSCISFDTTSVKQALYFPAPFEVRKIIFKTFQFTRGLDKNNRIFKIHSPVRTKFEGYGQHYAVLNHNKTRNKR